MKQRIGHGNAGFAILRQHPDQLPRAIVAREIAFGRFAVQKLGRGLQPLRVKIGRRVFHRVHGFEYSAVVFDPVAERVRKFRVEIDQFHGFSSLCPEIHSRGRSAVRFRVGITRANMRHTLCTCRVPGTACCAAFAQRSAA